MTNRRALSPRTITTEKELHSYPPDTQQRFLGDPAGWLPGRMTMHGASDRHVRMRLRGVALELQFDVGTPWTRGTSTTRHLHVAFLDPPLGMGRILPVVDGDLNLLGRQRFRLRFEGAAVGGRRLPVRRLSAAWLMRAVTAGIAARLSAQAQPVLPSQAWPT